MLVQGHLCLGVYMRALCTQGMQVIHMCMQVEKNVSSSRMDHCNLKSHFEVQRNAASVL